jgi:hypothetical protein
MMLAQFVRGFKGFFFFFNIRKQTKRHYGTKEEEDDSFSKQVRKKPEKRD